MFESSGAHIGIGLDLYRAFVETGLPEPATDPESIRTYLTGVDLPAEPPRIAPARPPPQQKIDFCD